MALTNDVEQRIRAAGGSVAIGPDGRLQATIREPSLRPLADRLGALGLEVQLVTAADTRATGAHAEASDGSGERFTLAYVFAPPTLEPAVTVLVSIPAERPAFPSLATRSFAASRFEREVQDLFGLVPLEHPDPRRLALHQFWPEDYHPLRRDSVTRTDFVDEGQPFPFRRVEGEGVFEITVGPVHAGIIEPGHFRFSVDGESILRLETRLGFVHKGVEKLYETLPFERTWQLAERVSGDTAVGHALAYVEALEALARVPVPPRAALLRVVLLELERLWNHVGDVGMIVNDTGFAFGHAHCFRLREEFHRLNERLTGHRLLRGAIVPGGVAGPLATADVAAAAREVEQLVREFLRIARLSIGNTMVLERLQGTGRLTTRTAREMQVVGLAARASGIDVDARRDVGFAAYRDLDPRPAVHDTGDVWARTLVRIDEVRESARLIRSAASRVADGPASVELGRLAPSAHALGIVEAWRGPVLYWVLTDADGRIARVKVADPSFRNWPALEYAVLGNIVPDFPLCNKSFNLSYSGADL
jgi:Ni,Fe-hydrogenase III large subunit/Ni,Fe-hydrogenase III component G